MFHVPSTSERNANRQETDYKGDSWGVQISVGSFIDLAVTANHYLDFKFFDLTGGVTLNFEDNVTIESLSYSNLVPNF